MEFLRISICCQVTSDGGDCVFLDEHHWFQAHLQKNNCGFGCLHWKSMHYWPDGDAIWWRICQCLGCGLRKIHEQRSDDVKP